jgi:hypothetical protein
MNINVFVKGKVWLLVFLFFFAGWVSASAEIRLTDSLSVSGFVRQMVSVHTAQINPNNTDAKSYGVAQEDNNRINLSRSQLQTEWTLRPTDTLKFFANMRFIWDQTDSWDNDLNSYDAFPLSTPHYGSTLIAGEDENAIAEIWELYADMDLGPIWFRIGKQQIVWGEMFGWQIMDCINPLDLSWHFRFEPEEFEHIRIPQWSVRSVYKIEQNAVPWLRDLYLEAFLNPGDVFPNRDPEPGAPYRYSPYHSYSVLNDCDRWGDEEYGFRLGSSIGGVSGTLNYLSLYSDSGAWKFTGFDFPGPPGPVPSPPFPATINNYGSFVKKLK